MLPQKGRIHPSTCFILMALPDPTHLTPPASAAPDDDPDQLKAQSQAQAAGNVEAQAATPQAPPPGAAPEMMAAQKEPQVPANPQALAKKEPEHPASAAAPVGGAPPGAPVSASAPPMQGPPTPVPPVKSPPLPAQTVGPQVQPPKMLEPKDEALPPPPQPQPPAVPVQGKAQAPVPAKPPGVRPGPQPQPPKPPAGAPQSPLETGPPQQKLPEHLIPPKRVAAPAPPALAAPAPGPAKAAGPPPEVPGPVMRKPQDPAAASAAWEHKLEQQLKASLAESPRAVTEPVRPPEEHAEDSRDSAGQGGLPETPAAPEKVPATPRAQPPTSPAVAGATAGTPGSAPGAPPPGTLQDMLVPPQKAGAPSLEELKQGHQLTKDTLGITSPNNIHVTPGEKGTSNFTRKDSPTQEPFAAYDAERDSLTLKKGAEGYSEDALNLAKNAPPNGAGVYLSDDQPRHSAEEVETMMEAGERATATAASPEERAAALEHAGLSPQAIRQRLAEGRLSVQQGKELNQRLNGITEMDSTPQGLERGMKAWDVSPDNARKTWLRDGTPEQQAVAINEYYDRIQTEAEGSLMADPERIEGLRRKALGEANPEWGKPGAASPGSAPKDGPPGFERIPLKDDHTNWAQRATLIPTGKWTAADLANIDKNPVMQNATPAQREEALPHVLKSAYHDLAGKPGFSQDDYRKFNATADAARQQVEGMKTWGDTAVEAGGVMGDAVTGLVRGTISKSADASIRNPDGSSRRLFDSMRTQSGYWMEKAGDTVTRSLAGDEEEKFTAHLESLKRDLMDGNFPFKDGEKATEWLEQRSREMSDAQGRWYTAAQGGAVTGEPRHDNAPWKEHLEGNQLFNTASEAGAKNRELLQDFIQTRDPKVWDQLEASLKKTPQRAATERNQAESLKNDKMTQFLSENMGGGSYEETVKSNGNPVELAMEYTPMKILGKAGGAAAEAGKKSLGREVAKEAGKSLISSGINTKVQNPDAKSDEYAKNAKNAFIGALGMTPLKKGVEKAVGKGAGAVKEGVSWAGRRTLDALRNTSTSGNGGGVRPAPVAPGRLAPQGLPAGPGLPGGPGLPRGKGLPDGPGMPTGKGMPQGNGMPQGKGMPEGKGMPQGKGMPEGKGMPQGKGMPSGAALPQGTGMPRGPGLPAGKGGTQPQARGLPEGRGMPQGKRLPDGKRSGPSDTTQTVQGGGQAAKAGSRPSPKPKGKTPPPPRPPGPTKGEKKNRYQTSAQDKLKDWKRMNEKSQKPAGDSAPKAPVNPAPSRPAPLPAAPGRGSAPRPQVDPGHNLEQEKNETGRKLVEPMPPPNRGPGGKPLAVQGGGPEQDRAGWFRERGRQRMG